MRSSFVVLALTCLLAACERGPVNPPTEPADPVRLPQATAAVVEPPGAGLAPPGVGPTSFVGRWAADPRWCLNSLGPQRAIEITSLRFEGYENGCDVLSITQVATGYDAALSCVSESQTRQELARFEVSGQTLKLTWLDRSLTTPPVTLIRCTTLADSPDREPAG